MNETIKIRNQKREKLYKLMDGLNMHEINCLFEQVKDSIEFDAVYKRKKH